MKCWLVLTCFPAFSAGLVFLLMIGIFGYPAMKWLVVVPICFCPSREGKLSYYMRSMYYKSWELLRIIFLSDLVIMFPILVSSTRNSSCCVLSIIVHFGLDCDEGSPRTACAMLQSCVSWSAIFASSVSKLIEAIGSACLKVECNHFEFWDERFDIALSKAGRFA